MLSSTLPVATASDFTSDAVGVATGLSAAIFGAGVGLISSFGVAAVGAGAAMGGVVPDLADFRSTTAASPPRAAGPLASGSSAVLGTNVFLPVGPTGDATTGAGSAF